MSKFWTPLCDRFEIDVPIFGFAHDMATVAAISNAGGYGVYGATRRFPQEITDELAYIRSLTGSRPFGVDLVLPPGMPEHNSREAIQAEIPPEHTAFVKGLIDKFAVPEATEPGMRTRFIRSKEIEQEQLRAVLDSDVNMLACGIGAPADVVAEAKARGKTTVALIGSPHHVPKALQAGVEIIVAQGSEHQGHMHPVNRDKLLQAGSADTVITRSESGKPFRQVRTGWSQAWEAENAPKPLKMPYQDVLVGDLLGAIEEHDIEPLIHSGAGQSIAYFNEVQSVEKIMQDLVSETRQILSAQAQYLG